MQKKILGIMILCLFTYLGFGQVACYDGIVFIGAYAKGSSTSFKFSEDYGDGFLKRFENNNRIFAEYDPEKSTGYAFGLNLGVNVASRMGILLDIGVSSNIYEYRIDELSEHFDLNNQLGLYSFEEKHNTVSINPLMRFQLNDDCNGIYALIGPHFTAGFSGSQKRYFDTGDEKMLDSEIESVSFGNDDRFRDYRGSTFGIVTGIGASFYLDTNIRLNVDVRRQHDFSNLYSKERLDYLETIDNEIVGKKRLRGTSLQVGIEYIISADK